MFQERFQPHKSLQLVFNSQSLSPLPPLSLPHPFLPLPPSVSFLLFLVPLFTQQKTHRSSFANREICVLCLCRLRLERRQREPEGEEGGVMSEWEGRKWREEIRRSRKERKIHFLSFFFLAVLVCVCVSAHTWPVSLFQHHFTSRLLWLYVSVDLCVCVY